MHARFFFLSENRQKVFLNLQLAQASRFFFPSLLSNQSFQWFKPEKDVLTNIENQKRKKHV
jgi:hypothetical protein